MTIRERTQRHDAANRAARQEYVERMYSRGWKPRERWFNDPAVFQDVTELISVALGCVSFLGACYLVARWVLVG